MAQMQTVKDHHRRRSVGRQWYYYYGSSSEAENRPRVIEIRIRPRGCRSRNLWALYASSLLYSRRDPRICHPLFYAVAVLVVLVVVVVFSFSWIHLEQIARVIAPTKKIEEDGWGSKATDYRPPSKCIACIHNLNIDRHTWCNKGRKRRKVAAAALSIYLVAATSRACCARQRRLRQTKQEESRIRFCEKWPARPFYYIFLN